MKPISTLMSPLQSVDFALEATHRCLGGALGCLRRTGRRGGRREVVAFEVAKAFLEKFGGDSLREIKRNYENYLEQIKNY